MVLPKVCSTFSKGSAESKVIILLVFPLFDSLLIKLTNDLTSFIIPAEPSVEIRPDLTYLIILDLSSVKYSFPTELVEIIAGRKKKAAPLKISMATPTRVHLI